VARDPGPPSAPAQPDHERSEVQRAVLRFLTTGLFAVVVLAVPVTLATRAVARDNALDGTVERAERLAKAAVAPYVTPELLAGDAAAVAGIDRLVDDRRADGSILGLRVWTGSRVLYSHDSREVGADRPPPPAARDLAVGDSVARVHQADEPGFQPDGDVVEVYTGTTTADGRTSLLVEVHYPGEVVAEQERQLLRRELPLGLAALLVLQGAQLPPAVQLARRMQQAQRVRRRLLQQAVVASDMERRRIARHLHDDVLPGVAGAAYALGSLRDSVGEAERALLDATIAALKDEAVDLRGMLVDLYPPDLRALGLGAALSQLVAPLREAGAEVDLDVAAAGDVGPTSALLVYRVAREAVSNTARHARARHVRLSVRVEGGNVVLRLDDDGIGFDPTRPAVTGHIGSRLVRDTVEDAGGSLVLRSAPGEGTSLEARVPRD
jgi:signal transduction histidine kinase